MILSFNFDLLSVATVVAMNLLLGFAILYSDWRSATARLFFTLTVVMSAWSILNYLTYQITDLGIALWIERLVLFFAVPMSVLFVLFVHTFPGRSWALDKRWTLATIVLSGVTMSLTLTPLIFSNVHIVPGIETPQPTIALGIGLFALVAIGSIPIGIYLLVKRFCAASGEARKQLAYVLWGVGIMFTCIIFFNFIAPTVFQSTAFIPLSAIFVFPFIALTAYSIYRYHLFNLKVALTALLGVLVTVFSFVNIIYSRTSNEILVNLIAFAVILLGSIKIVKDTLSLEQLTEQLEATNERQETLIHFIGHEVKGFLGKAQAAFAALIEGDFGELPRDASLLVQEALRQTREGVTSVTDILQAANQKRGSITYEKKPFDLSQLAIEAVSNARKAAEEKGLNLTLFFDETKSYPYTGDKMQLGEHGLRNLLNNAINYTPKGSIEVKLERTERGYRLSVKDTGVGINAEDMPRLFTEGGRGKDALKVNAHSTGYGLYIAKHVVEAHGGTIRAESEGPGKGSTFIIELPANSGTVTASPA